MHAIVFFLNHANFIFIFLFFCCCSCSRCKCWCVCCVRVPNIAKSCLLSLLPVFCKTITLTCIRSSLEQHHRKETKKDCSIPKIKTKVNVKNSCGKSWIEIKLRKRDQKQKHCGAKTHTSTYINLSI